MSKREDYYRENPEPEKVIDNVWIVYIQQMTLYIRRSVLYSRVVDVELSQRAKMELFPK